MKITGKLIRDTNTGKEFGCYETYNADLPDDIVVLRSIDTEYYYTHERVEQLIEGDYEIVRELHNKKFPNTRKRFIDESVSSKYD